MILDENGNEVGVVKTIGTKQRSQAFHIDPKDFMNWDDDDEDDDLIEQYF